VIAAGDLQQFLILPQAGPNLLRRSEWIATPLHNQEREGGDLVRS
jgi:hypothetical protein